MIGQDRLCMGKTLRKRRGIGADGIIVWVGSHTRRTANATAHLAGVEEAGKTKQFI